ncbi:MAG: MoxR family ATPase [Spirochaetales bacterium]|nr:MoxR family ATPase [Spirochaetales bacterium]
MNAGEWAEAVRKSVGSVIYGKDSVIEKLQVALLCGGHVLLEDVPGVGKTILARAFAATTGGRMQRIQCTPDLLPSDVLGVSVYNQQTGDFTFRQGPVVTNVLLVDEINRATPRTQSAFFEAMEEGRVTLDGRTIELPGPFFVIATENPVEFEGTFPLPEAQRDRFFLSSRVGYPPEISEKKMLESQRRISHPVTDLVPVADTGQVLALQKEILSVAVDDSIVALIMNLVETTRKDDRLALGASPRVSMALYRGAQALAAIRGRDAAVPDDVGELAVPVLRHRISVKPENQLRGMVPEMIVRDILEQNTVPHPGEAGA